MPVFTKTFLQNYKDDYNLLEISKRISSAVIAEARRGQQTRYLQQLHCLGPEFSERHTPNFKENIQKLIEFLKLEFPDSNIEYKEAIRLDGSKECGIVVDWS